jgi:uncharacterized repeat protein (TIGR01451 family)
MRWFRCSLAIGLAAAAIGFAGRAGAMTADGTLVTNVASITFRYWSGASFGVSFNLTATVLTTNPCLTAQKTASPMVQASGGLLTFTLWVINCSPTMSAFNINVTDRLPNNAVMGANLSAWNGGSGGSWYPASGTNNTTWAPNVPPAGQGVPYFLRYVLDQIGPSKSGFVSFTVSVL